MKCRVSMNKQNIAVVTMLWRQSNPGTGIYTEQVPLQLVGPRQRFEKLRTLALDVGFIRLSKNDDKFIATQTGTDITVT